MFTNIYCLKKKAYMSASKMIKNHKYKARKEIEMYKKNKSNTRKDDGFSLVDVTTSINNTIDASFIT